MNLKILCEKICLPSQVSQQILAFTSTFDCEKIKPILEKFYDSKNFISAPTDLKEALLPDDNGIKTLSIMLNQCLTTKHLYDNKGICEDVFFDTMKCFTRFVNEHFQSFGFYGFDRHWWTSRQIAMTLFRLGELEYEMYNYEGENAISIHIPSNCILKQEKLRESYFLAKDFFAKFYPDFANARMFCHSWLLSPNLKELLNAQSNIVKFSNNFDIIKTDNDSTDFLAWVFKTENIDIKNKEQIKQLPQTTTLQKNIKEFILDDKIFYNGLGFLKENPFVL
ncbi:MAG: acyltransferase domain-containing protein [Oscillospiraceae bacterium]